MLKPGPGHGFKGGAHAHPHGQPGIELGLNRIDAVQQLFADVIAGLAGLCQRDRRIGANGEAFFFAANAVLPASVLAPSGQCLQVETATVGIALAGLAFGATRILASGVYQGHLGDFWLMQPEDCDKSPKWSPNLPGLSKDAMGRQNAKSPASSVTYGAF